MATVPNCTESVDEIPRRSSGFFIQYVTVHEFVFSGMGAQLTVPANPRRIRLVLYAPSLNTGTIYWGGPQAQPAQGDRLSGPNAMEIEPGTGWEIDDTTAAIYCFSKLGDGDQALRWYEASDDPRIPMLVSA